jgi:23S rRNA (uracil1939-C5)-methyltransferase
VLTWGAIPGERVRARVERATPRLAFATAVEILMPSPDRREPPGDWRCGGSVYAHIVYDRQLALKSLIVTDAFGRIAGVKLEMPPRVEPSPEQGYRMRARLHVRDGRIGFFREGTHELCDPASSRQLAASSIEALQSLETLLAKHAADVLGIDLTENVPATERAIHLTIASGGRAPSAEALESSTGARGVSVSHDAGESSVLWGEPYVTDDLDLGFGRVRLRRHARAFFQGNRYLLATLAGRVVDHVPAGEPVLDLYSGGGLFAVPLAARGGSRIAAVEGDGVSGEDLRWNGRLYGRTLRTYRRSVEAYLREHPHCSGTVIVDPPRTGMSAEACAAIRASGARQVVYVSCDVATLARDVKSLAAGGYRVTSVESFDLFPSTAHIETLVVLTRETGTGS